MENSNIKKQAKSDIFKELYPILKFYIQKGAKPSALKKYYKNSKRFNDILEDIKNKGINLVKDETEYHQLVKEILNEILDDFIAKEKDDNKNKESKMKHIKEYNSFNEGILTWLFLSVVVVRFILYLVKKYIYKQEDYYIVEEILNNLSVALKMNYISIYNLSDRYYFKIEQNGNEYDFRLLKVNKILNIVGNKLNNPINIKLTNFEYNSLVELIENNEKNEENL
ncbi:hypothetical protein M0Q97_10565 [Candidatus Dojkabacteria bacterium]|jgi:hypothetical protein|nr:hypothetical protein [Candidatus Dojkabacteria bacterium]